LDIYSFQIINNVPYLFDLGSNSGTKLNRHRVLKHALKPGDVIRIGKSDILFDGIFRFLSSPFLSSFLSLSLSLTHIHTYIFTLSIHSPLVKDKETIFSQPITAEDKPVSEKSDKKTKKEPKETLVELEDDD
jgi:pSer/pThr/pTyr-binding forkhead associated (FHA) protein